MKTEAWKRDLAELKLWAWKSSSTGCLMLVCLKALGWHWQDSKTDRKKQQSSRQEAEGSSVTLLPPPVLMSLSSAPSGKSRPGSLAKLTCGLQGRPQCGKAARGRVGFRWETVVQEPVQGSRLSFPIHLRANEFRWKTYQIVNFGSMVKTWFPHL